MFFWPSSPVSKASPWGTFLKLTIATRLVGGDVKKALDTHIADGAGNLLIALVGFTIIFAFVNFLYRRKIFLRL